MVMMRCVVVRCVCYRALDTTIVTRKKSQTLSLFSTRLQSCVTAHTIDVSVWPSTEQHRGGKRDAWCAVCGACSAVCAVCCVPCAVLFVRCSALDNAHSQALRGAEAWSGSVPAVSITPRQTHRQENELQTCQNDTTVTAQDSLQFQLPRQGSTHSVPPAIPSSCSPSSPLRNPSRLSAAFAVLSVVRS